MIECSICGRQYEFGVLPLHCSCGRLTTDHTPKVNHWDSLHRYPCDNWQVWNEQEALKWYLEWEENIPEYSCQCRATWAEIVKTRPVDTSTARRFFLWAWARHNDVSAMIGKLPMALDDAMKLYGVE